MVAGLTVTVTAVITGTAFTVTAALPDFVVSSVDVAVIVAVPDAAGVNRPALEMVPIPAGLTDQVTALEYAPVPVTVAVACVVCAVVIVAGLTVTDTEVIVGLCGGGVLVPPLPHPTAIPTASTATHTPIDQRGIPFRLSSAKPIFWSIVRAPLHS
ncbi:MAG: hypothetical protein WCC14_00610, partial [Acidobacteriaceae bacterium]